MNGLAYKAGGFVYRTQEVVGFFMSATTLVSPRATVIRLEKTGYEQ